MKKKVIFISQALWIGGIETALVNLLNHLDYDKYDVSCLIVEDYQEMADRIKSPCNLMISDRHHQVSFSEEYRFCWLFDSIEQPKNPGRIRWLVWKLHSGLLKGMEQRLYAAYLRKQMAGKHFDTVVIYSDRTAELAVRALDADRFLMFYHNADIGRAYHDIYGYRKSEKIIAVSESQCRRLKAILPRYAEKITYIHNYIDVDDIRQRVGRVSEEQVFSEPGIHLVSCGRLAVQKGFDLGIEACAAIIKEGFTNLHWYVLGNGPERDNLLKQVQERDLQDHFHLIGPKENPFPYMLAADLYVQPSRSEGYSLSVLEARALACPIVATYAAGEEQLTDNETGTLCTCDKESLIEAILLHLNNPELSLKYRKALAGHNFEEENRKIIQEIEALI